ncbi:MAG: hypothetical protein RSF67_02695 [Clostridia bacterium]
MKKEQILKIRQEQQELCNIKYRANKEDRELLERCKEIRSYTWICNSYIDRLFETENALDKLLMLKEQGFINFEVSNKDIINYVAYKSKIAKALEREVA